MSIFRWSPAPPEATPVQRKNFINVQIDAVGIGLANAAAPFLPVFLTRLGASAFQVGLLTSMPSLTGLVFAILVGRFLQTRRNVVPWFSAARLMVVSSYALTGLAGFFLPVEQLIPAVLLIWAFATLPQTVVAVAFSVVMNAVAGPNLRYDLMSRRWSVLGLTTAVTVAVVGQILDRIGFPLNYQVVFLALSVGGLISFYFSSHLTLPDVAPPPSQPGRSMKERLRSYFCLITSERDFVSFSLKRFAYLSAITLATPILPLYYVNEVRAPDSWIGAFNTTQTAILLVGYYIWTHTTRRRGSRFVMLSTTLGLSFIPALIGSTHRVELILIFAGLSGIFQAGLDLVFFDELMKTVPPEYSATFVSLAQSMQYLAGIASPLIGTALAGWIGLSGALLVSSALRLGGFGLFAFSRGKRSQ